MKLEDEIKQSSFRNEYHKLAVNIIYTHSWLMNKIYELLDEYDLTPQQFNLLRILRGQYPQPASISLLKERMLDKMSDASRLVERLISKGLVERNICPEDRRKAEVKITKKGLKLLEKIDAANDEMDNYLKNLSAQEAKQLNYLLDKLRG
ncbi:MAG: MarR family transcriptional regulator [Ignavibacteria bacterium]|jgi:DNA-binding MarR family transcriptional regulator|nr:MarR family transcriptional regulator [Ignavibacteria bacterium]MDH7527516.1 MarR family transcriptional regulator [Ignavibacteria bacterium]NPV12313.1 MarR family transcriptional regulator [Ignavibacteria bacterium]